MFYQEIQYYLILKLDWFGIMSHTRNGFDSGQKHKGQKRTQSWSGIRSWDLNFKKNWNSNNNDRNSSNWINIGIIEMYGREISSSNIRR